MHARQLTPPHARPSRAATRGYSIVELLIVLTVLAIAAALATPMFSSMHGDRLRSAAQLLVADLEMAQIETITKPDDPCLIVIDETGAGYSLARSSDPATPITHPTDQTPYMTIFGASRAAHLDGVEVYQVAVGGDNQLGFRLYGQLDQTTPAVITLREGQSAVTVTLAPTTGEIIVSDVYPLP